MLNELTSLMLNQIKEIDERDESQILGELAGETIKDFVYEILDKKSKKRTVKLSWMGTREVARARGNITLSDPLITEQDGYLRVVIRGTDLTRNFSIFGGCHQPKQQKVKIYDEDGKQIGEQDQPDPYYFSKALSKAQRNVIQTLIPAEFAARMIDKFLAKSGREPLKQLPTRTRVASAEPKPRLAKELPELKAEDIPDYLSLEKTAYSRWHIQPAEVYRQLGYVSKTDCAEKPWDCYLRLRAIYENAN